MSLGSPIRHENVFDDERRKNIYGFLIGPGWENGWKSHSQKDAFGFLHKHFAGHRKTSAPSYDCEPELQINAPSLYPAWTSIKDKLFPGHTLVRCYANGMCYGMDGTVHTDANEDGNYTAVYYPHERWSPNWGGETMFYNREENKVVGCFYPKPNSIVVFNGRIPHRANGVTRQYTGMRITLMFKTEKKDAAAA